MPLKEEKHIEVYSQNFGTMIPGSFQKYLRTCVIFQFFRFLVINIKILIFVKLRT